MNSARLLKGKNKIGTTKRGIGPAYGDKAARTGLRMIDLMQPERFEAKLKLQDQGEQRDAQGVRREAAFASRKFMTTYREAGEYLQPFVANTVVCLHEALQRGDDILFEGAQGTFLDIDHGTYPYVTSSNTTAGGACTGSGVPPHRMDRVVGRDEGLHHARGRRAVADRECGDRGHAPRAWAASSARRPAAPRRCGWFDAVATRHATMVNGIDELAVTNVDGLDSRRSDPGLRRLSSEGQTA